MSEFVTHYGSCHCGRVSFEVDAPADVEVLDCNCSICTRVGFLHLIVPTLRFRLTKGADDLSEYRFGTGVARHTFCRHCGIKAFYVPRSHPDQISVNLRCIEPATVRSRRILPFDGRNWERARSELGSSDLRSTRKH